MMTTLLRRALPGLVAVAGLVASGPVAAGPAAARSDEPALNYIHFHDGDHTSMSGDTKDIERARRLRHDKEPMLWFRDAGQEYVIRDAAVLAQADALWKGVQQLGEAQGKLGNQQGALGSQQGRLGTKQAVLGTRQGALGVRQAALDMRASSDSLTPAQAAEIAEQRRELKTQMRALEAEMLAMEKPMKELGDKMAALGREMEVLGRQMEAAVARSTTEMRGLMRRAIASGAAKPIK